MIHVFPMPGDPVSTIDRSSNPSTIVSSKIGRSTRNIVASEILDAHELHAESLNNLQIVARGPRHIASRNIWTSLRLRIGCFGECLKRFYESLMRIIWADLVKNGIDQISSVEKSSALSVILICPEAHYCEVAHLR